MFTVIAPGCTATKVSASSRREARRIVEDAKRAEIAMYRRAGYIGWAERLSSAYFGSSWVIYEAD